jgi:hypothetical protein
MKKFLFLIVFLTTFSLFGQQLMKWHKVTNYTSTSEMVWSDINQEYLFFDNRDYRTQSAVWDITLDVVAAEGFITSGDITYRVNKATIEERDGISMVVMETFNERLNIPVMIIASTIEGEFKLAIYVQSHKRVYYFYE